MIGQTISRYKIAEKLGEGGMGEVYLAEDTSLKRKVALKFLPDYLQQDEVAQKRFLREAQSAAALDHPFICKIFETGDEVGQSFIAMEYIKGQTLKDKLLEGPVPLKQTLQIGMEIAEALEEAHTAGIAHRDLKPANIMLTSGGHVKVMDFGLAKKVVDEDGTEQDITSALTREGTTLGTLAYMSPEQLRGKTVDTRSDIFSFGIVLYELLSGVHPFRKPKQVDTTDAILRENPSPLSRYTEDTADLLQHTVEKMLEKDADDRYQTVHEVRSNLKKLSEKLSAPVEVVPAPVRKKRGIWLGAGAVLVVLVGVFLGSYFYQLAPTQVDELPIDSIAVLPFVALSEDEDCAALADGIPSAISSSLLRLAGLKVKPSAVLTRYKGKNVDPRTVSDEQDVSAVLMGTVASRGDSLAVDVSLIDGRDNTLIWGKPYNRVVSDIFIVQEEIARQVAEALRRQLTDVESEQFAQRGTESQEAYQAYLQGEYRWNRGNIANEQNAARTAIAFLEKAVKIDPSYQEAYERLARRHFFQARQEWDPEGFAEARAYWNKIVEIDDSTMLAHTARAGILWRYERQWKEAEAEYLRAAELDPSFMIAGGFLDWMGRQEERLAQLERQSEQVDPFDFTRQCSLAWRFLWNRKFDRAIAVARKASALEPEGQEAYMILKASYMAQGLDQEALGATKGRLQRRDDELPNPQRPVAQARYYVRIGDLGEAINWLRKSWESPLWGMENAPSAYLWDPLRSDPRFEELLRKLNLPEEAIQRHLALH